MSTQDRFIPQIVSVQEKTSDHNPAENNGEHTPRQRRRSYEEAMEIDAQNLMSESNNKRDTTFDQSDVAIARNGNRNKIKMVPPPLPPPNPPRVSDASTNPVSSMERTFSGSTAVTVKQGPDKGIQEVYLSKDAKGKLGIKVKNIKKGIYVMDVVGNSPAAIAGIFLGDRLLQINGVNVDGYDEEQMHKIFKKQPANESFRMLVNKRPLEKVFTFTRDSNGRQGFLMRGPKIHIVAKDSPAAIQGLSNEFYVLEVNGKLIRGMKDSEVRQLLDEQKSQIKITVMPYYLYEPLFKQIPIR